ncbi:MAG: CotH kinase family protein [Clostridia bacterium]
MGSPAKGTGTGTSTSTNRKTPGAATNTPRPTQSNTVKTKTPAKATPTSAPTPTMQKPTSTPNNYNGNKNFTDNKIIRFSHPSGYYAAPFTLKLNYNASYKVYYTLNGNAPTTSAKAYQQAGIAVNDLSGNTGKNDDVVVVRAAAFQNGKQVGTTVTATYIINKKYASFAGRYNNLAVISISTDKTNLYGSNGIFTNYTEHGRESERPAHVEFFDSDGTAGYSVDAGLRVYGGTSRANPQKSLKLVARKEYDADNGKFKYPMIAGSRNLSGNLIDRYDSFILRAGGNDNLFGGGRNTFLRDALIHSLAGKMSNIVSQAYRPVVVYINGDYFGVYNLRDDIDNDYLEQHYNVPKEEVAIVTYGHENGNWFYKIDEGTQADLSNYQNMLTWIANNNMASSANYNNACKMLDMDNFIKYIAVNVFANNRDWPHNNVRAWKYTGKTNNAYGQDGKWRFMLKDIDYSWGIIYSPGQTENVVAEETAHSENVLRGGAGEISAAFASLMRNSQFKQQFLKIMEEMVNNYFSASTASAMITAMKNAMAKEYSWIYTNVWYKNPDAPAQGEYRVSLTYDEWIAAIDTLYEYARKRPAVISNLVKTVYG